MATLTVSMPRPSLARCLLFGLFAVAACLALWPGLDGPFLLDDAENLTPLIDFESGHRSAANVLFGNRSGALGRPVSMASFLVNSELTGLAPYWLKLTNLLIHLACGLAAWGLYRRLFHLDSSLAPRGALLAALLAGAWLILPAHVSTVLYVIQRMAQLSALFMLLALWAWVIGRCRAAQGRQSAWAWLLIVSPALTVLAALSKENGALVPLLAFAIELAYFRPLTPGHWPRAVRLYFAAFLLLPAMAAVGVLITMPEVLLGGYANRAFTFEDRLLSQPRILWDYVGNTLLPYGPRMGLYHDNFPLSQGWLSPPTTLLATLGWIAVVAAAIRLRATAPSILAGILLFLAGHAMESSLLPLEPYFEHRNYLPSIGLLLAVVGALDWAIRRLSPHLSSLRPAFRPILAAVLALLAFATFARSAVWADIDALYAQELRHNPTSPRMRSVLAAHQIEAGRLNPALEHIAVAEAHMPQRDLMAPSLWRLLAHCTSTSAPPEQLWQELRARTHLPTTQLAMKAWEFVALRVESGACSTAPKQAFVELGSDWLARTPTPGTDHGNWRTRYYLARVLASASQWERAIDQGDRAWQDSKHNNGVGIFLFQVNATVGNVERCREILAALKKSRGHGDLALDQAIDTFENALAKGSIVAQPTWIDD